MANKIFDKFQKKIDSNELGEARYLLKNVFFKRDHQNYPNAIKKLEYLATHNKKIVLHGAGWHTSQILDKASSALIKSIVAITDNAKVGLDICGIKIISIQDLLDIHFDYICMSSDIHQKNMKKELLNALNIQESQIVDLYKVELSEVKAFIKNDTKYKNLLDEINNSKNPCIIVSNSIGLNHPRIFKYLNRYFDLFVITSNNRIQAIGIAEFKDVFRIELLDSTLDIATLINRIDKGIFISINGIYWNSLGAICTLFAKQPTYAWFVDFLSSAYVSIDKLSVVCDAKCELSAENFLWRYSDGAIYKESALLAQDLITRYQPKKTLQFLDYCDSEVITTSKEHDCQKLKFVYAGGLLSQKCGDPNCNHHMSIKKVAEIFANNNHSFSIYNAYDEGLTSDWDYYKFDFLNFKYNKSISIFNLPYELSSYDIGIVLFNFDVDGVENKDYYAKGGFSKIMAYVEAELPIVISKETTFMAGLVEKYEIGIALYWHEIKDINLYLTEENILKWKSNIKIFKEEFSYGSHIDVLLDFLKTKE